MKAKVFLVLPLLIITVLGLCARWVAASVSVPQGPYSVGKRVLDVGASFAAAERLRPAIEVWYPVASRELEPAAGRWPLLLYFSGWPGTTVHNRFLIHDLVTQGFAVAVVTYPQRSPGETSAAAGGPALPDLDFSSQQATRQTLQIFDQRIRESARDSSLLLDELTRLDAADSGWLSHRLDLSRVGIFGFSWGGAVAVTAYWSDPRIGAAVLLDQNHWLDAPTRPDTCDLLMVGEADMLPTRRQLSSKDPYTRNFALANEFDTNAMIRQFQKYGGIQVKVPGTVHGDFSDAVLTPSWRHRLLGRISPRRKLAIINSYVITYLKWKFLKVGEPLPEHQRTRFPEVEVVDYRGSAGCPASR